MLNFYKHQGLRSLRRVRHRRGATLLVTVLLGLIAATITLVIVRSSLDDARVTSSRRAYDLALTEARDKANEIARSLSANPFLLLESVDQNEPDRICNSIIENGNPLKVSPGEVWPSACGTDWVYSNDWSGTTIFVQYPNTQSQNLKIRAISEVAGTKAGFEIQMRPGSRTPAIFVEGDADLSKLRSSGSQSILRGVIYSTGSITAPTTGIAYENVTLASEGSISVGESFNGNRFAGIGVGANDKPVRELIGAAIPKGALRSKVTELLKFACSTGEMVNTGTYSNKLCLEAGKSYINSAGSSVTAPSNTSSWLLLPELSAKGMVDIYTRSAADSLTGSCINGGYECDLASQAAATTAHPSNLENWASLGTFRLPSSGIITTDSTTYLGLCGAGFNIVNGECTSYRDGEPGLFLETNLTIIVGSPAKPSDLFISGPLYSPNSEIGLVVTGDLLLPFWARPKQGSYSLEADLLILGRSTSAPLRTYPSSTLDGVNKGGQFSFQGLLAISRLELDIETFASYNSGIPLRSKRSPWWSITPGWENDRAHRIKSSELADPSNF